MIILRFFLNLVQTATHQVDGLLEEVPGVSSLCLEYKSLTVWADHDSQQQSNKAKMTSLTAKDKDTVREFWGKVGNKAEDIGAEALAR